MIARILSGVRRARSVDIIDVTRDFGVPIRGVLHVGGNVGSEAAKYGSLGSVPIVWIEGFEEYFDVLTSAISEYPFQRAYCVLVSDVDGEEVVFRAASNTGSSTSLEPLPEFRDRFPDIRFSKPMTLRAERLDLFFDRHKLVTDSLNILVLDIEGAELKALRSLGDRLGSFDGVLVEVSIVRNFVDGPLLSDIDTFLYSRGFRRVRTRVGLSSGDAFYLRGKVTMMARHLAHWHARGLAFLFHVGFWKARRALVRRVESLVVHERTGT